MKKCWIAVASSSCRKCIEFFPERMRLQRECSNTKGVTEVCWTNWDYNKHTLLQLHFTVLIKPCYCTLVVQQYCNHDPNFVFACCMSSELQIWHPLMFNINEHHNSQAVLSQKLRMVPHYINVALKHNLGGIHNEYESMSLSHLTTLHCFKLFPKHTWYDVFLSVTEPTMTINNR